MKALQTKTVDVGSDIDGVVIRGTWRARVALGDPGLTIVGDDNALRTTAIQRTATTLTVLQTVPPSTRPAPELRVTLRRLRGVATSGAVSVALDDGSEAPLFLDLAGTGSVQARGSVPLIRVTTSGSVNADLTGMMAKVARAHARGDSRLTIRAKNSLTIVALDTARVCYEGTTRVHVTRRRFATVTRLQAPNAP